MGQPARFSLGLLSTAEMVTSLVPGGRPDARRSWLFILKRPQLSGTLQASLQRAPQERRFFCFGPNEKTGGALWGAKRGPPVLLRLMLNIIVAPTERAILEIVPLCPQPRRAGAVF
jgi:hypothetical protein